MLKPLAVALTLLAVPAAAQQCGGSFSSFLNGLVEEAASHGIDRATAQEFLAGGRQDQAVLNADRSQGFFQRDFIDFSRRLISNNRIQSGRNQAQQQDAIFDRIEAEFGIPRGVLLAFWAFETDFGAVQGDFNTRNALVTLAHDCRRPELFRPQVFAAMVLFARGDFDPARTTGAWAGEIGMVQMLPGDIIENGRDGDGDGHVNLKTSAPDALYSGASVLASLGVAAKPAVVARGERAERNGLGAVRNVCEDVDYHVGRTWRGSALGHIAESGGVLDSADGSQRAGFPRLPEFRCLFRVEPIVRLCADGGLFWHAFARCTGVQCGQS